MMVAAGGGVGGFGRLPPAVIEAAERDGSDDG